MWSSLIFPGAEIKILEFCGNRFRWNDKVKIFNTGDTEVHCVDPVQSMPLSFYQKPALVVYVTCGDPDLATTRAVVLAAIDAGADVIELGVPFSDPGADGPVIQRAGGRAVKKG